MFELKINSLAPGDEFTQDDGRTWYRCRAVSDVRSGQVYVTFTVLDAEGRPTKYLARPWSADAKVIVR